MEKLIEEYASKLGVNDLMYDAIVRYLNQFAIDLQSFTDSEDKINNSKVFLNKFVAFCDRKFIEDDTRNSSIYVDFFLNTKHPESVESEKKEEFLAWDGINNEHEEFDTIEDAIEYLEECFFDGYEGYHPDSESCKIYKLHKTIDFDVIATKKEGEKWSEEQNYPNEFDEICKHKWINQ